jgi:site-specific recombinase XerD
MSYENAFLARPDDLRYRGPEQHQMIAATFLAGYREPTRSHHAVNLKQWFRWCAERPMDPMKVERAHIELYSRWMEEFKGLKLSTVANQLGTLGRFYHHCMVDRWLAYNPAEYVKRPSVPKVSSTNYLTRSELLAVLDAAEKYRARDHALVCILGLNGPRIGEVLAMDIEDMGRQSGYVTLRVKREKGGETPIIPLSPRTSYAVDRCVGGRQTGPIFLSRDGTRLDRAGAGRIIARLCRSVGIDKRITPHSLRHTFITLSLDAGASVRDVQHSVGHRDARQVSYYDRNRASLPRNSTHIMSAYVEGS